MTKELKLRFTEGKPPRREWRVRSIYVRDKDLMETVEDYAQKKGLKFSGAVEELLGIAFEVQDERKMEELAKKVQDKKRASLIAARTFDFRKDCFACGQKDCLVQVHGHIQCSKCGCNVEPCCD